MPATDLSLLVDAAHVAAEIALKYWQTDQQIREKDGGAGPVSEGDLAVDEALREMLLAARPDYGWLSEETEDTPARLSQDTVFIVDPIDGTRSYVAGQKTWAHSIAVVHKGQPTAAVVMLPARDKFYSAVIGQEATLNDAPIAASPRIDPDGAQILSPRPALKPEFWPGGLPDMKPHFRSSLAYRLCLAAEGRFDAMLTLRDAWEWDIAAGALIARQAGATVSDRLGNRIEFNSVSAKSKGVLTAPPQLHEDLTARLNSINR